jgi:RimJ/RimL family protein N-acetyltransferase
MNSIQYTGAKLEDAVQLISYLKKVSGETPFLRMYPEEIKYTIQEEESFIKAMNEQENSNLIIARDKEMIIGVGSIQGQQLKKFRHCGEFGVSVLKHYWRKGIGKELTIQLIEWAKENQLLRKIILHVNIDNKVAIELYKKTGFVEEGILKNDFFYEGRYIDTCMMALEV